MKNKKNNINAYLQYLQKSRKLLLSLLIGSLGGAIVMLLFAPQSGKSTRAWIFQRITALQDQI